MVVWSQYVDRSNVSRGNHIYALRKLGIYQHHGVVIGRADAYHLKPKPEIIEEFMVIEQNLEGLRVVTLENFVFEDGNFIKRKHSLRRVQYGENSFVYGIKRRGSSYIQDALPPDLIVQNAVLIYNDPKEKQKWSTYSLLTRNCEHFAFKCCVETNMLSEQVLAKYDLLSNTLSTATITVGSLLWGWSKKLLTNVIYIGEKLVPSSITNLTITSLDEVVKASLLGNAITSGIALIVEISVLTIRWVIYLCVKNNAETLNTYLAAGFAIDTKRYVKSLIQAGISNLSSFGMSIAGAAVGAFVLLPGATVGFSILFGFIGYTIARWGAGGLLDAFEKMFTGKNE
ncbi:unnamed protein product [Rotaria magnacalcarata]|uniref:LRAT domain-containing protein n=2 Tax=Rotaria magnacalcarata TaxID=392030 RepID=A0A816UHH2_9BILA|nr:unnamed protein product [Rotaria magnacalcarata]CAF1685211.1 unnamed protein product [Rotaria magnacalcarata]CAF2114197.1 unnamed protein product [Rotaria magnacalcarata]CAF3905047.1 unnamed protein product [Rotaria magnacalcarata]CAF4085721.1 unnamed protein product [Rotaria magnacalcarata]